MRAFREMLRADIGWRAWAVIPLLLAVVGCATGPRPVSPEAATAEPSVESCRRWYADLDALVSRFAVNDAQDRRIDGFPQLRQSRWTASLRERAGQSDAAFEAWMGHMRLLGDQGHAMEIANVPAQGWRGFWPAEGDAPRAQALARTQVCADLLDRDDLVRAERRAGLRAQPGVPDAYSTLARWLGVYAISRWPFGAGVERWQAETQATFVEHRHAAIAGAVQRYVPMPDTVSNDEAEAIALAPRDALGVPILGGRLSERLLDRHAPVLEISPQGDFDRLGEMTLAADGSPRVHSARPTVYRRIAFSRQGGSTLVQLVYLFWFSERPKTGPLDLLGGALDGLIWRVTLDEQGQPLIYDSIHACGCYHLFFPTPSLRPKPPPEPGEEWAFVPAKAPRLGAGERVVLGIDSRTHYLNAVTSAADLQGTPYQSLEASDLRSLPTARADGQGSERDRRSLYGPDGIVPGSQRGERYFFWPMGVRDAGAQRQWGHHATAFVGRRHFDDPDLIERRFERVDKVPFRSPSETKP